MNKYIISLSILSLSLAACRNSSTEVKTAPLPTVTVTDTVQVVSHVMTKEQQEKLTPDDVIRDMIEGNVRFQRGNKTLRDHSLQARLSAPGQYPKAVVISCLDSRIPVEDVFDQGLGDIFVGRVAGNFVNEDLLGSMEFACMVSGAKLIVVVGHQSCGAIKSAIDDVKVGNITAMLSKIKPAVKMSQGFTGEKTSKNAEFVREVSQNNVRHAIQQVRQKSKILKEMEDKGQIKIVGAYYNLADGRLEWVR